MANTKTCGCCSTSKNLTQYYKSPIDGGYVAICKNCCRKKIKEYIQEVGNENAAVWLVLAELGIPYFSDIWKRVETYMTTAGPNTDIVMTYLRCLSEDGRIVKGFWESDRMLDQLIDIDVDREETEVNIDWEERIRVWGKFVDENGQVDEDAYDFLDRTFDEYTSEIVEMDANLEKRYRDLAKAEFRKRRADESGDIQDIAKAQENLKKILDMLKLSDFQSNKQSETEKFIERMAWNIENTKPAECEDLNKYKDFSGFEPVWKDIMRTVGNLVAGSRDFPDVPKNER